MSVIFSSPTRSRHSTSDPTKRDSALYTRFGMLSRFARTQNGTRAERPMPSQSDGVHGRFTRAGPSSQRGKLEEEKAQAGRRSCATGRLVAALRGGRRGLYRECIQIMLLLRAGLVRWVQGRAHQQGWTVLMTRIERKAATL